MGLAVVGLALYHSGARLEWSRLVRALIAAALAAAAAWTVKGFMPVLPTLAAGGLLLAAVYAAGTLLLGFWSAAALRHVQDLHAPLAGGRPFFIARTRGGADRRAAPPPVAFPKKPPPPPLPPPTSPAWEETGTPWGGK